MTAPTSSSTRTYAVTGMTCAHCVASVREEVSEIVGVTAVDVDLASGRLTVRGAGVTDAAVATAVDEAGYALDPSPS
jgi:copper chaperone CopZ